jgi:hypothetical protein
MQIETIDLIGGIIMAITVFVVVREILTRKTKRSIRRVNTNP